MTIKGIENKHKLISMEKKQKLIEDRSYNKDMNRLIILKPNNPSEVNDTLPDHIVICTGFLSSPTILVVADDSGAGD